LAYNFVENILQFNISFKTAIDWQ